MPTETVAGFIPVGKQDVGVFPALVLICRQMLLPNLGGAATDQAEARARALFCIASAIAV